MPLSVCPEIPGHTLHVIQRGRLHAECFFSSDDRAAYLAWLGEYAKRTGCALHAYALMGNHVHLLLTPSSKGGVASLMRLLRERHARHLAPGGHLKFLHPWPGQTPPPLAAGRGDFMRSNRAWQSESVAV